MNGLPNGRIIGIGVDIIEVERIEQSLANHGDRFRKRVFTDAEWDYCHAKARRSEHLAGRFAAKEAVLKALGTGWKEGTSFAEVEVVREHPNPPEVQLSGRMRALLPEGNVRIWLSISHTEHYAVAQAIITLEDGSGAEDTP